MRLTEGETKALLASALLVVLAAFGRLLLTPDAAKLSGDGLAVAGSIDSALAVAESTRNEAERRKRDMPGVSASAFFKMQLEQYGLRDRPERRVISEPFSRYLRGVRPGFADVSAAYVKATLLFEAFEEGKTEIMPFVLAGHDVGVRPFDSITREDRVERSFLPLLDRLGLPKFRTWVRDHFTVSDQTL